MRGSLPLPLDWARSALLPDGSVAAAAEELHVTPYAVSHQVLDLEDHLEVRLFVRRTRALELTPAGHLLVQEREPLLTRLDEAIGKVAKQARRSTVRLALPPFFASELFIPQLTSLLDLRPDLDLRIETSDPRPAQHAAADDVSIVLAAEEPGGVTAHRLFRLSLIPVASPELAQRVDELGVDAFSELPLIMHRAWPTVWRDWALAMARARPSPGRPSNSTACSPSRVRPQRGVGLALVPAGPSRVARGQITGGASSRGARHGRPFLSRVSTSRTQRVPKCARSSTGRCVNSRTKTHEHASGNG